MSDYEALKTRYEEIKKELASVEARRDVWLEKLKAAGYDTPEAAVDRITELEQKIEKTEIRIAAQVEKLKEALDG